MASELSSAPVNGNYAPHSGYGGIEQPTSYGYSNSNNGTASTASAQAAPTASSSATANGQSDIPKDEVGWFFVEQYYTTLSRNPEKLYLFYAKRSQFVSGQETEKVQVCVGQRAINDKIKQLDFQDCKVRVTNVDSQSSDSNIVIQVVGEISNKSQPHKKFTQTFVLAAQTNGYFVLNDIFRYLVEEEDEYEAETGAQPEEPEPIEAAPTQLEEPAPTVEETKTLTSSTDPAAIENAAKRVDKELEEKLLKEPSVVASASTSVNGEPDEADKVEEAPTQPDVAATTTAERASTTGSLDLAPEKPKDPEPTPVATPPPKATAPPAAAVAKSQPPAAPKTWANLVAANKIATPAVPAPASSSTSAARSTTPSGGKAPAAATAGTAAPPTTVSMPAPPASAQRSEVPSAESQDEWTAVGGAHSRQQSRQTNGAPPEPAQYRGYIKNVFENVDSSELRSALEKFGELAYFDIARQKNCAFVDFKTVDGYNKATSTPIELGDDKLYVEERRVRPGSTPYVPRGQFTGGRGGRGGAGPGQGGPRGGFQGNRGNFVPRGRGTAAGQRGGRGAPQAS